MVKIYNKQPFLPGTYSPVNVSYLVVVCMQKSLSRKMIMLLRVRILVFHCQECNDVEIFLSDLFPYSHRFTNCWNRSYHFPRQNLFTILLFIHLVETDFNLADTKIHRWRWDIQLSVNHFSASFFLLPSSLKRLLFLLNAWLSRKHLFYFYRP